MSKLTELNELVCINEDELRACIDVVEHKLDVSGKKLSVRLHHLKFDANGLPMVKPLAELLYQFILDYCIASRNRQDPLSSRQMALLVKEARSLFRHPNVDNEHPDNTGEAGEALLFLLIEAVLKAPQMVAKMELKTNRKDELKGSDGIHMRWCPTDEVVDVYFGESKLYQNVGSAIASALSSIDTFHEKQLYKHELTMVTKHFKYADEEVKKEIEKFLILGEPSSDVRINHACLIGYDWDQYKLLMDRPVKEKLEEFKQLYLADSERLLKLINSKFENFERTHLFLEVFFIPFPSVSEFRNAFNSALD
jgi:hypothetical protein